MFEEKSRNYTGIDFSKAGRKKKVLITGFDPFLLDSFKYPQAFNILQSNPSGVVGLALTNNDELGAYIQTMVVPVRYIDFDGSQENKSGHGEGIIEKYVKPFVNQVDMIITISQYLPKENVIDKFSTATRGGFNDNLDFTRINGSHALVTSYEWIETTLPKEFTNAPNVVLNWKYNGINNPSYKPPTVGVKLSEGSGGDYLSNEIMYRATRKRDELSMKNLKAVGHVHIADNLNSNEFLDIIKKIINNATE